MDFVETCRRLIAVDSSSSHGSQKIAEVAAVLCHERGLQVDLQTDFHGGLAQANVIARPVGLARAGSELMLQTHLDTIDPGPFQMWAKNGQNPFDAVIMDGRLHGLGAADSKLDFLCKLEALASFGPRKDWKLPPVLVGTYGEEAGMAGALKLIRKNMVSAKMAVVGEPTDLRLVNAAKGFAKIEILLPFSEDEARYRREHDLRESTSTQSRLFHGKASHSSSEGGESAILKMLDFLEQLPGGVVVMEIDGGQSTNTTPANAFIELEAASVKSPIAPKICALYKKLKTLEAEFENHADAEFTPPAPTLNIGLVRTLEDHVQFAGSCRLPPSVTQQVYEQWMQSLGEFCRELGGTFRMNDYKKPFRTPTNSILVKGCLDELRGMNRNDRVTTQSSANEASLFSRIGVDCVCFGPGSREGNVQDESVLLDDLKTATEFYRRVIGRFCL